MNTEKKGIRNYRGNRLLYCAALLLAATLCLPGAALAETINGNWVGNTYGIGSINNSSDASYGVLIVNGGSGTGSSANLFGGASSNSYASYNKVIVNSGSGPTNSIYGGYSANGRVAMDNTVTVHAGTWGQVVGGWAYNAPDGRTSNNHIILHGGQFVAVIGGKARSRTDLNIVDIYDGVTFSGSGTELIGGTSTGFGNTLNVFGWRGSVDYLGGFQILNFYVPETMLANESMITIGQTADVTNAFLNVGFQGGTALNIGDQIVLIDASNGTLTVGGNNAVTTGEGMVGISKLSTFNITYDDIAGFVYAELVELETQEDNEQIASQLKSLAETRVSGIGMLTQGADILSTQGIPQLRMNAANASGPAMFGVMGGQSLRYNSGSHVDVDGFNLATGLGWNFPLTNGNSGNLLLGAFFEAGWGSYDSHNSFSNAASVNGDGDTNYYGAGILARYDTAPVGPGNIYLETSFRAGTGETDYKSSGFETASGNEVDCDSSAAYYGAHAGIGYIWNISEAASLDMYTKYLWTRQDSDSMNIEGDSIRFKAMDSHRWRSGAKFNYAIATESGRIFTPYIGAAYEHEFDSKARATSNGDSIDAPDVKGDTGIGELGMSFKPADNSGLSFDLGMQGYTGKREGVGGSLQVKFEF